MKRLIHSFLLAVLGTQCVLAHVEMKDPPPRHSQYSKYYADNDDVDYNMKSPLGPIVGYPCRSFSAGPVQGTLTAGRPFHVQFDGVATHMGGDCQFAISYDNGTTFAVIWDKLSSCFLDTSGGGYDVPIPEFLPASKHAVFAWTWINGLGSREYYMNCADVRIENYGKQEPLTGRQLLVVNLPGKPVVPEKTGREEDHVIALLKNRPFVTVGKPMDMAKEEVAEANQRNDNDDDDASSSGDSASEDSADSDPTTVDPVDDSDIPDEITSYITATKFITEDDIHDEENTSDLDAGFTYGKGAMGDGHIPETLSGFGDDSTILMGSFTKDPLESLESTTADSFETFTHLTGASHGAVGELGGLDLWPESSSSSMHEAVDLGYEKTLGTQGDPLSGPQRPFDYTMQGMFRSMPVAEAGATSAASKSVHMVTHMATTMVHGTPVLQVVVSADNTIIPESLTISYPT